MGKKISHSAAPREIYELVRKFTEHAETYRRGDYNETQLRRDFLDPFFKALGWDIDNRLGYSEKFREVIHEDALLVERTVKAPDYCFRIGGQRQYFVEAKKPSVNIKEDIAPAFQLRRYAWTAKLALSILTDFEELAVYDCRVKPDKNDRASVARVMYFKYTEYAERWNELLDIFSPHAIRRGAFDKYAESKKKKRGTAEVDEAFLEEIETWRESLAKNLSLRNKAITDRELNFSVTRIIDRIIFLRMCEGRGIEPFGKLQSLLNGDKVYKRLVEQFHRADEKYNSGLFHFQKEKGREEPDTLTTSLVVDDKVLKGIIRRLYYPDSPYEFAALPADILGQVYEQFLGKVIRLTKGHQAKIEEKPEVRKAGGVYYTPTYIVDYIVENTLGKLLEGETPQQIGGLTKTWNPAKTTKPLSVLDPACGSGSFLIVAYQYLLDWYLKQYTEVDKPEKHARGRNPRVYRNSRGDWRLTTPERKRILLAHIYGVDIDYQAVEVTKLSLLLKVLEGATEETLQRQLFEKERALPDLANNIKCGNSLIGSDFYRSRQRDLFDEEEQLRINAFDWEVEFPAIFNGKSPGFDAVIGNPPYDVVEKDRLKSSWPHSALRAYVQQNEEYAEALGGKTNLFRFFLVRALQLTRNAGRFGMILPLALLADVSCSRTRAHVLQITDEAKADCFPQKDNRNRRVFRDAKLSTMILTVTVARETGASRNKSLHVRAFRWNSFHDTPNECHIRRIDMEMLDPDHLPVPLTKDEDLEVCRRIYANRNVVHLGQCSDFAVTRGEINQTIYRAYITDDPAHARLIKGVEIGRYFVRDKLSQGQREWFDEDAFLAANGNRPQANLRRIATQRITGVDERLRVVATVIEPPAYFADSTNSITAIDTAMHDLDYLLGLLNSRLFQWRFRLTSTNNNVGTNELDALPFRVMDFSDTENESYHERFIGRVRCLKELLSRYHRTRVEHEKVTLRRQIAATNREIDQLVYELYGLSAKEIAIVEEATR